MKTIPIKLYEQIAGSLSKPSKMPGWGYGLPALKSCNVGSQLAQVEGSVCASCYACKGHYTLEAVVDAQTKRLKSIKNPSWVTAMVALISSHKEKYFRWHDSGDLVSLQHLGKICQVAVQLPHYVFWLPTQERMLVRDYMKLYTIPPNLCIRLSTAMIDQKPATILGLPTSSVHKNREPFGYACPASTQGNKCGACRACWNKNEANVSYKAH